MGVPYGEDGVVDKSTETDFGSAADRTWDRRWNRPGIKKRIQLGDARAQSIIGNIISGRRDKSYFMDNYCNCGGVAVYQNRNTMESKIIAIGFLGWCIATLVEPFTTPFLMGMFVIAYYSNRNVTDLSLPGGRKR